MLRIISFEQKFPKIGNYYTMYNPNVCLTLAQTNIRMIISSAVEQGPMMVFETEEIVSEMPMHSNDYCKRNIGTLAVRNDERFYSCRPYVVKIDKSTLVS